MDAKNRKREPGMGKFYTDETPLFVTISTRVTEDERLEVLKICADAGKTPSELLRDLIIQRLNIAPQNH